MHFMFFFQFQITIAARFDYLWIINCITTCFSAMNNHDKILGDMLTKTDELMDRGAREQLKNKHDILENNITKAMECFWLKFTESALVAATSVASLSRELIQLLLKQYAVYGDYSEEILDSINLLIKCGDLQGVFIWNRCDKIMNLQDVDPAVNGQYINASAKFEVSSNNFIRKDMINGIVTKLVQYTSQNNVEFAGEYVLCVSFETLFAAYNDKKDLDNIFRHQYYVLLI